MKIFSHKYYKFLSPCLMVIFGLMVFIQNSQLANAQSVPGCVYRCTDEDSPSDTNYPNFPQVSGPDGVYCGYSRATDVCRGQQSGDNCQLCKLSQNGRDAMNAYNPAEYAERRANGNYACPTDVKYSGNFLDSDQARGCDYSCLCGDEGGDPNNCYEKGPNHDTGSFFNGNYNCKNTQIDYIGPAGGHAYDCRSDDRRDWSECAEVPPVQEESRTCSISINSTDGGVANEVIYGEGQFLFNVNASSSNPSPESGRLVIAKSDYSRWVGHPDFLQENPGNNGRFFYIYKSSPGFPPSAADRFDCSTSSSVNCNDAVSPSGDAFPIGEYVAFCDVGMKAPLVPKQQCTGNPNCSFNGGEDECGNWAQDCGDSDGSSFRVLGPTCEAGAPSTISQIQIKPAGPYAWTDISSTSVDSPTFLTMYDNLNTGMTIRWPTPTTDTMTDYYEVYVWNSDYINNPNPNVVFSSVLANASGLGWGACWADGTICKYRVNRNAGFSWHQQVYEAKYTTNSYRPNKLAIAIRGINSDCPAPPTPPTPGGYNLKYFDLVANISGRFYEIAGSCPSTTTTLAPLSGGINRNLTWNNAATSSNALNTVSNSFSYVMQAPYTPSGWGTHTLGLTIDNSAADPEDYYLIAPSCQNPLVNKLAPSNNNNFYVTKFDISNASWWQVINGLAYAGGIMNSTIPDTCGDSTYTGCINAVSIKEKTSAHDKSAAPPLTGQGSIEAGDGDYSETSNDVKSTGLNFSAVNNAPEDYEHFTSKVNLADGSKITTIGSSSISSLDISPNRIYSDTTRIYSRQGNLTISSGATISVPANEKKVVFVDGNLTINPATFDVPQSSYLGFIVSGDITFAKEVGHTIDDSNLMSDLAPNVSGVFIADRIIIAGETNTTVSDKKFIGEGTFVGWQGINLNRDFDDSGTNKRFNNGSPTESFIYRPAYLETTPTFMKAPGLFWQEVN